MIHQLMRAHLPLRYHWRQSHKCLTFVLPMVLIPWPTMMSTSPGAGSTALTTCARWCQLTDKMRLANRRSGSWVWTFNSFASPPIRSHSLRCRCLRRLNRPPRTALHYLSKARPSSSARMCPQSSISTRASPSTTYHARPVAPVIRTSTRCTIPNSVRSFDLELVISAHIFLENN